jgi:hypothetical protein
MASYQPDRLLSSGRGVAPDCLRVSAGSEQDSTVLSIGNSRPNRSQIVFGGAAVVSYGVGYPVAIVGDYQWGWILVALGGVFLLALGTVTIARIHRGTTTPR